MRWIANNLLGTTRKTLAVLSNPATCTSAIAASSFSTSSLPSIPMPACADTNFTNNSRTNNHYDRSSGAQHYSDYTDPSENLSSLKSNGWNWMTTCDHNFLRQQMSNIIRGSGTIRECSSSSAGGMSSARCSDKIDFRGRDDIYDTGTTRDGNAESHIWSGIGPGTVGIGPGTEGVRSGTEGIGTGSNTRGCFRSMQRPPSLRLLEDVIMPAIGQCCAERGINADGIGAGTGKDSQNLLAAVDEGITFLRGKYRSIV